MKSIRVFLLLLIICGCLPLKSVWALEDVYNNVNIDYRFFVDEDENDAGNLKFKLYDNSGTLNFESKYDSNTKQYYFEHNENTFEEYSYNNGAAWGLSVIPYIDESSYEKDFREYVLFKNDIYELSSKNDINNFISLHNLHGEIDDEELNNHGGWNLYSYKPLVLEELTSHKKSIVFASFALRGDWYAPYSIYYVQLYFVNNTLKSKEENLFLKDSFLDNVDFMRKTTLDYSDELWEELNNGPIASSEIYTNNINSNNYHYLNQSINSSTRNVAEETIEDYATSLPVLNFRKNGGTSNDNNTSSIVDIITNPQTFNNGMAILIISLILVLCGGLTIIKSKKSKV